MKSKIGKKINSDSDPVWSAIDQSQHLTESLCN